jgi:hypothetical protein
VHDNLENLNVFSKVNYGYNEDTIKGFGKKPVADVYINNISYGSDLLDNSPDSVTTFIICYLKGNMNKTYLKACELTDYLIQEFEDNLEYYLREIFNIDINPQDGVPYEIWPEWVDAYEEWLDIESPFWKGKDNESTVYYIYQRGSSSPSF